MAWLAPWGSPALVLLVIAVSITGVGSSKSFNVTKNYPGRFGQKKKNITINCSYTVWLWPGISSGAGSAAVAQDSTGFELAPGESCAMPVPSEWSGRVWGRTLCMSSTTDSSGKFSCVTGDCGSGKQDCAGGNAAPPVTLAQFTMGGSGGNDLYDVSLVDGFNLPMLV